MKCACEYLFCVCVLGIFMYTYECILSIVRKAAEVFLCSALLNQALVSVEWLLTLRKHSHASQEHSGQASQ